jgi:hypothetical protein
MRGAHSISSSGEGEYEQSEQLIQRLFAEAGSPGIGHNLVSD